MPKRAEFARENAKRQEEAAKGQKRKAQQKLKEQEAAAAKAEQKRKGQEAAAQAEEEKARQAQQNAATAIQFEDVNTKPAPAKSDKKYGQNNGYLQLFDANMKKKMAELAQRAKPDRYWMQVTEQEREIVLQHRRDNDSSYW